MGAGKSGRGWTYRSEGLGRQRAESGEQKWRQGHGFSLARTGRLRHAAKVRGRPETRPGRISAGARQSIETMKGNPDIIEALNAGLTIELTAINLYFIHSKMCKNWGLARLAAHYYKESIEEMKHAEEVIDRILYLEGVPEMARYDVIKVGENPRAMIENGLELEMKGVKTYNEAIGLCIKHKDAGSRDLMERNVVESEESVDWAEAQLDLIRLVGLENYLAQQIGEGEEG